MHWFRLTWRILLVPNSLFRSIPFFTKIQTTVESYSSIRRRNYIYWISNLLNWKNEKKFRLEIFCFLIGALAIISVKKQKRLSTSLFDQRKREATNTVANGNRSFSVSENDDEIEFTPMTNQQKEMVSLMEINNNNDHMEIIWDYNRYNNNIQY